MSFVYYTFQITLKTITGNKTRRLGTITIATSEKVISSTIVTILPTMSKILLKAKDTGNYSKKPKISKLFIIFQVIIEVLSYILIQC